MAAEHEEAPRRIRVRRRAIALGLVLVAVAGPAVALERVLGPRGPAEGVPEGAVSGAWFCPHGGGEGWRGWVVITNPGPDPAGVRLTSLGPNGVQSVVSFSVPPERQVYRDVTTDRSASATQVEYFGGWVGASSVVRSGGASAPVAAARCAGSPARAWFLPDLSTGRAEHAFVTVMNPFAEEASFDVIISTERRDVRPKPLSPFVLRAHHSVAIQVNDHVLKGPGERTVAVVILPRIGRVVAGGLVLSDRGLRGEGAVAFLRTRAMVPAAGYAEPGQVLLMNARATPADLQVVAEGSTAQRPVGEPGGISLGPGRVRTLEVRGLADAGVAVEATEDGAVAAAMRLVAQEDLATIAGAARGSRSWLVLPTLPPTGGQSFLALQNSGLDPATVSIRLIGPAGPVATSGLESISVPSGRTIRVPLPTTIDEAPLSAVVTARAGTLVVSGASYTRGGVGYAASLGIPMKE